MKKILIFITLFGIVFGFSKKQYNSFSDYEELKVPIISNGKVKLQKIFKEENNANNKINNKIKYYFPNKSFFYKNSALRIKFKTLDDNDIEYIEKTYNLKFIKRTKIGYCYFKPLKGDILQVIHKLVKDSKIKNKIEKLYPDVIFNMKPM